MSRPPLGGQRWPRRTARRLALLAALTAGAVLLSLLVGAVGLTPGAVLRALFGGGDPATRTIIRELRLPRTAMALLTGGALAMSGAVFQALVRNPLAEPYILGVSGGAAVGATLAVGLGLARGAPGAVPLAALVGALGAILLVFRIAGRVSRGLDTRVLLLAGVVLGAFFNAVIVLLLSFANIESFRSAIFWLMGSVEFATWGQTALLAAYLLPSLILILGLARPLNLLAGGEETALYLGVRVERVKTVAYLVTSLMVAATVALCGVIGFVGLVIPHALRLLWSSDHRLLLPGSFLAGGTFLLLADTVARTVVAPGELPIGVITALVGVPVFVVLLVRRPA